MLPEDLRHAQMERGWYTNSCLGSSEDLRLRWSVGGILIVVQRTSGSDRAWVVY